MALILKTLMSHFQNVPVRSSSRRSENFNSPDFIGAVSTHIRHISRIEFFAQRRDRSKWGVLKLALAVVLLFLFISPHTVVQSSQITGGSPYGASTIAGTQGERTPTDNELEAARFQGKHVATIAGKLAK